MIRLFRPDGASPGDLDYSELVPRAVALADQALYVFATGFSGGRHFVNEKGVPTTTPVFPLLVIMRWKADGTIDGTFAGRGWQEAGFDPDRKFWSVQGALRESATSFFLYGMAGKTETVSARTIVRQPQPALFKFEHPTGLDMTFGGDGSAIQRLQEVLLTPVAGALLSGRRVRRACVDVLQLPSNSEPATNQAGLAQWQLREPRPHPPLL
jgi:hypothetical protein